MCILYWWNQTSTAKQRQTCKRVASKAGQSQEPHKPCTLCLTMNMLLKTESPDWNSLQRKITNWGIFLESVLLWVWADRGHQIFDQRTHRYKRRVRCVRAQLDRHLSEVCCENTNFRGFLTSTSWAFLGLCFVPHIDMDNPSRLPVFRL